MKKISPSAIIAMVVSAQIAVVLLHTEFWPLNPYQMFSYYRPLRTVSGYRLWGVSPDGGRVYFPIRAIKWKFVAAGPKRPDVLRELVIQEAKNAPVKFREYVLAKISYEDGAEGLRHVETELLRVHEGSL